MAEQRSEPGVELSVILPTYNERDNISALVTRLHSCLQGIEWEAIFVDDDSQDGTADRVREIARADRRVRVLHRVGRRGLASACIEGMLSSSAPYLAVMDADLQHDEQLLPAMLTALKADSLDMAIGSRYVPGGSTGAWSADRAFASRFATRLSEWILKTPLQDPMSGFFMLRRDILHEALPNLSAIGFKILLDIISSTKQVLRVRELPYTFRARQAGESKLDSMVIWEYLMLLLDKSLGRYVPVRFIPFAMIGGLGVFVHMAVLWLAFQGAGFSFAVGQGIAALVAMTSNFFINNLFTYRDRRLEGWGLVKGWISFSIACSIGAISNVGIATYLFEANTAGWISSALIGIVVGAVWNYAVTSVYTWSKPKAA
ncbi:MAG TPA: glycosyltransferase family 2 protein [Chromatiaceae bacterium]|nr:MAG: hypothetical protein N838_15555 [Thiohalocapsa sp. PB-PSB1]QQO56997.1 MAG: glycosyltransferase family 2 protein [Thiohalocapsa sp. PB-PSB1]HBG95594.1 glycosyltransferase family 2 protein [Chromatiaceae bacterium]HCS92197.1 glycosyltransferase family 2 protein [Chromatiaceae bacterium]